MLVHVGPGEGIGHALVAQGLDELIEQGRGVTGLNRRDDAPVSAVMKTGEIGGLRRNPAKALEK